MRYVMRQKLFSWGDDFVIRDEAGEDRFSWTARSFSLGNQLSFQDMQGNELAFIRQKLLAWGPTYEIYGRGQLLGGRQEGALHALPVQLQRGRARPGRPGGDGRPSPTTSIASSGAAGPWRRSRSGGSAWTDTYGVEIAEGEDDILILASAVVIDMACHGDQRPGGA